MKLTCVANCPLPYHTPILNELRHLVDLHVIYMSRTHPLGNFRDGWGERPEFDFSTFWSSPVRWRPADFRMQFSCGVAFRLQALDPDVVLFSSWGPLMLEPLVWKRLNRRKAVMWAESTDFSGLVRGGASDAVRRVLVGQVDAFVTNGSKATEYLTTLGVAPERIVTSCLPSPLRSLPALSRLDLAAADRQRDGPQYLFVGRLVPLKRPLELIAAFSSVLAEFPQATLTLVGDGLLADDVARAASSLAAHVRLLGRVEGERLSALYRAADILVFPSTRDVWGLVLNEALAHGLYVVTTDRVGSAYDLLDGENGAMVAVDDFPAFTAAMIEAARTISRAPAAREARSRRVSRCTPAAFANDMYQSACRALEANLKCG